MKKTKIIKGFMVLCAVFLVGCSHETETKKDETVVLKEAKSVCDDIVVECEEIEDYSRIYYYDYESGNEICACSQANCSHDVSDVRSGEINCNAIIAGTVKYPFIYQERLYYFVDNGSSAVLWSSKTDGTDKKEETELEESLYSGTFVLHQGKVYVASYYTTITESDTNKLEQTGAHSEVYEINLENGKVNKLTDFGEKAEAYCSSVQYFDGRLFIRYYSRNKSYADAGFEDADHFLAWMESDKFSYAEQIARLEEKEEYYIYDFYNKKVERFDIGFESNFEPYQGIKNMDSYYLLCYVKDTAYYLDAVVGKYNIYSYNTKNKERKEIFASFKNNQLYYDRKIYITSMDMDETTKDELIPSVDLKKEPKYYIYDIEKDEMVEQNYGESGKIFYPIDLNPKGLLVYEVSFDAQYDFVDEHNIKEIPKGKLKVEK